MSENSRDAVRLMVYKREVNGEMTLVSNHLFLCQHEVGHAMLLLAKTNPSAFVRIYKVVVSTRGEI